VDQEVRCLVDDMIAGVVFSCLNFAGVKAVRVVFAECRE